LRGNTLLACLKKYSSSAPDDGLIFPSPAAQTVDKHLDRIIIGLIDKATMLVTRLGNPRSPAMPSRFVPHAAASARCSHLNLAAGTLYKEQLHGGRPEPKTIPNPDLVQKFSRDPTPDCLGLEACGTGQFICAQKNVRSVLVKPMQM